MTDGGARHDPTGSWVAAFCTLPLGLRLAAHHLPVHGPDRIGELRALDAFGRLFLDELWQVFDPLRRGR